MDDDDENNDLPLMSNTDDILVSHYIFNLLCNFNNRTFKGSVILFLKSVRHYSNCMKSFAVGKMIKFYESYIWAEESTFMLVLDCCDITISKVTEIKFGCSEDGCLDNLQFIEKNELDFSVHKWALRIMKSGVFCPCEFPEVIEIEYETMSDGKSLMWVADQDGRPCVYTYGAWINNRSLFPCQEPPVAMATWEAIISVCVPAVVLMSGDDLPVISHDHDVSTYYYHTKMELPMSTLALAVGFWDKEDQFSWTINADVAIRIFASPSLLTKATIEFSEYIFACIKACECYFGPYPLKRIDFLFVPRGFNSLGMASPNIIFLSQSLLCGDGSMCNRIAHEISHTWFGLLIGALDWTEEWLSEGFATFMEDVIHTKALKMTDSEEKDYIEMRAFLRKNILIAEIQNTEEELHLLRPAKGESVTMDIDGTKAIILKNGRNPEKAFMQVHYIKGFFLLKYLSLVVGHVSFLKFLKLYINKYKGQLVESLEMLEFFMETFQEICKSKISIADIVSEWLHSSAIPQFILDQKPSRNNAIFTSAVKEVRRWKMFNQRSLMKQKSKKGENNLLQSPSDMVLVLLDMLLEVDKLTTSTMKSITRVYDIDNRNAEIRHKWCELVVKHRYYPGYKSVENFLLNDLAMGIYLYGELILNGTTAQRDFAIRCFKQVEDEMESNCTSTICQMLESSSIV